MQNSILIIFNDLSILFSFSLIVFKFYKFLEKLPKMKKIKNIEFITKGLQNIFFTTIFSLGFLSCLYVFISLGNVEIALGIMAIYTLVVLQYYEYNLIAIPSKKRYRSSH
jgi:hypothetical protein